MTKPTEHEEWNMLNPEGEIRFTRGGYQSEGAAWAAILNTHKGVNLLIADLLQYQRDGWKAVKTILKTELKEDQS